MDHRLPRSWRHAGYRAASHAVQDLADRAGAQRTAAWVRLKLADAALIAGDTIKAIELGHRAVGRVRALDWTSHLGLGLSNLCGAQVLGGQNSAATASATEALPLMWASEWGYLLADPLALLAAREGRWADAGLLLGFVDGWFAAHAGEREINEARQALLAAAAIEGALGAQSLAQLRREGALLTDGEARCVAEKVLGIRPDT